MPTRFDATELKERKKSLFQIGQPLVGKTRALLTCPKPVWIADFDQNSGALDDAKPGEIQIFRFEHKLSSKITREQHRPQEQKVLLDFIDWVNSIYDMPQDKAPATLAIDSLDVLGNKCMEFVLSLNQRKEPVYQDWGQAQAKIREIVESCVSLPYTNFVLNAHEATERDELLGKITTIPDTIGKLAGQLGGSFDAVVWARKELDPQTKRTETSWLTVPDGFVKQAGVRNRETPKLIKADWNNLFPPSKR